MHRSLYYLAYTTRVPVLLPDRFLSLLWGGLLYHQILPAGAFTGCALGRYRRLWRIRVIYWGYRLRYQKRAWIWRRQVPRCLGGAWHCWETLPLPGFPCRYVGLARFGVALQVR